MPLFANLKFNLKSDIIGFGLTYVGFINILLRAVFFGKIINRFGENKMKIVGLFSLLTAFILLTFINNSWLLLLVLTFFAFGGSFVRPILTANISRSVSHQQQGTILGVTSSLQSLSQIIGPILGGFILTNFSPNSLGVVSFFILLFALILAFKNQKSPSQVS